VIRVPILPDRIILWRLLSARFRRDLLHAVATLMRKTARIRSASRPAQMRCVGPLIARSNDGWQLLRCIAGPLGLSRCPGAFGVTPRRRAAGEQDAGRLIAEDGELP